jgi:hypothetical protein
MTDALHLRYLHDVVLAEGGPVLTSLAKVLEPPGPAEAAGTSWAAPVVLKSARKLRERLEGEVDRSLSRAHKLIAVLDRLDGDPDREPDADREPDEDFEPTLGWNERDAPKDLWLTDGGHGRDGDDD